MAVEIGSGPGLELGKPRPLFEARSIVGPMVGVADDEASPDGQQFLVDTPVAENPVSPVTLLLSWMADLNK